MRFSLVTCSVGALTASLILSSHTEWPLLFAEEVRAPSEIPIPLTPNTSVEVPEEPQMEWIDVPYVEYVASRTAAIPKRLTIPSITLSAPVVGMGVNGKGELDVPDGDTKDVGWYKHGTIPGEVGSAVLDAHVYAAFNKLRYVKIGDDIYIDDENGEQLHFVVESSMLYKLSEVPRELLFHRNDGKRLNLITCAGKLTKDKSTYTHRLVVYAVLVEE